MSNRIVESDILLPALYIINKFGTATTSMIRKELVKMFNPQGEDAVILKGRSDSKFTQIIRNLVGSHATTNDFGRYTNRTAVGFTLNNDGIKFLEEHFVECEYIYNNDFQYEENLSVAKKIHVAASQKKELITYVEDNTVVEGKSIERLSKSKRRSAMLRETAVEYYRNEGHIKCSVCGFDFLDFYGPIGYLYIQIHHEHPICEYESEGTVESLKEALKNVKPVCANCHCMLHRKKNETLSINELKDIIKNK